MIQVFLSSIILFLSLLTLPGGPVNIWVAPSGNDNNPGTQAQPLSTVAMALRRARNLRRLGKVSQDEPVKIILQGGVYHLDAPLLIRMQDSGTPNSPTIFMAENHEHPILSGGLQISGWHRAGKMVSGLPANAQGKVWVANVPVYHGQLLRFHQMWVNNQKAILARYPNKGKLDRLVAWNPKKEKAWIARNPALDNIRNVSRMDMVIDQVWEIARLRLKTMSFLGNNASLTFLQPNSRIEFQHPWPPVVMNNKYHSAYFLENAIEFLNEPGEWYEDMKTGKIYYWPKSGQNMASVSVVVSVLKTIVKIEGSLDRPVKNIKFKGIEFAYSKWSRPYVLGSVPLQDGMYLLDAYKLKPKGTKYDPNLDNKAWIGRPPSAVVVRDANHISFVDCKFEHTASAGLDFQSGTHNDLIRGNIFEDIGGNGIQMGVFSKEGVETHIPYSPKDKRVICSNELISNNLVTNCGTEDWGSVGICVGYGRNVTIEHNDVFNLPYTGISVGWGWTKLSNCMRDNKIYANRVHNIATKLGDTGGLYTLSSQPGTIISDNSVYDIKLNPYVYDPNHWFYVYLDEGSSHITISHNWCPSKKFFQNANGPGVKFIDNGPQISQKIKRASGLQAKYKYLLTDVE